MVTVLKKATMHHLIKAFSSPVGRHRDGPAHTSLALTIVEANNIAYSDHVTTKNHYCTITLGVLKCKTPSVKAKCWPTWNYKVSIIFSE